MPRGYSTGRKNSTNRLVLEVISAIRNGNVSWHVSHCTPNPREYGGFPSRSPERHAAVWAVLHVSLENPILSKSLRIRLMRRSPSAGRRGKRRMKPHPLPCMRGPRKCPVHAGYHSCRFMISQNRAWRMNTRNSCDPHRFRSAMLPRPP